MIYNGQIENLTGLLESGFRNYKSELLCKEMLQGRICVAAGAYQTQSGENYLHWESYSERPLGCYVID